MTVKKLYQTEIKDIENLTDKERQMILNFAICCDASVKEVDGKVLRIGDPTELALIDVNNLIEGDKLENYPRVLDLPFDSDRKLMTTVIKEGDKYLAITKGAPDIVVRLSTNEKEVLDNALQANNQMAENALRVLALGVKYFDTKTH